MKFKQIATYWKCKGQDGYGSLKFEEPELVYLRWTDVIAKVVNPAGSEEISNSEALVQKDMYVDDYLYLGESDVLLPQNVEGARRVISFKKLPNGKATKYLRKAWLR